MTVQTQPDHPAKPASASPVERWVSIIAWVITAAMVGLMVLVALKRPGFLQPGTPASAAQQPTYNLPQGAETGGSFNVPTYQPGITTTALQRKASMRTIMPNRPRSTPIEYTVQQGDSVFSIANDFKLKPESILWANYETLNDDPDMLSPGLVLIIPPTDGVLYKWKEGDSLENIASQFEADFDEVLTYPGNKLDMTNPTIAPESYVMLPGGHREFRQWLVPTIPRGRAGVLSTVLGSGGCDVGDTGVYGSGFFIWPADNHYLSGNDYWSGHLAIDIAAGTGALLYAADSGQVVYAGGASGGYGLMVMIDHGNGYQTLYAHMSIVSVRCGQGVYQGQVIGQAGSTGNSTGPHLHFEVRYLGGFINPWYVLP